MRRAAKAFVQDIGHSIDGLHYTFVYVTLTIHYAKIQLQYFASLIIKGTAEKRTRVHRKSVWKEAMNSFVTRAQTLEPLLIGAHDVPFISTYFGAHYLKYISILRSVLLSRNTASVCVSLGLHELPLLVYAKCSYVITALKAWPFSYELHVAWVCSRLDT